MSVKLTIPLPAHFLEYPGDPKVRWSNWIAQLRNFFTLTNLTLPAGQKLTDQTKNVYLASLLGTEGSRILMAHPIAAAAETATFEQFIKDVATRFERPINSVRAEFDFRNRRQGATESVADYLTALRTLYADCDILCSDGAEQRRVEDHNLAMQLAIGCRMRRAQEKLLQETKVDLNTFVHIMQADESATEASSIIRNDSATTVGALRSTDRRHAKSQHPQHNTPQTVSRNFDSCVGCGKSGHKYKTNECPAFRQTCNFCKKPHHFSSHCLGKKKHQASIRSLRLREVSSRPGLQTSSCAISLNVRSDSATATLRFTVDTGADISTIQHANVSEHFPSATVQPAASPVYNYDGTVLRDISGFIECDVTFAGRCCTARLYVVPDSLLSVVGRDIIHSLDLVIDGASMSVRALSDDTCTDPRRGSVTSELTAFPSLTCESLGTFPDYDHTIQLTSSFTPHVTKLRPIPYAKRDAVNAEIQSMIDSGVWSPIGKSESAHAMVIVSKKSGGLRITTDFSPLNDFVIPERFPLPLVEDLLLQLRGMQFFSKLDLCKGYYHIRLSDECRHLTATLTPLGLMAYNRLPMGLRDSASAFQKCVSSTLSGCRNAVYYVDDILVFGRTQVEHDASLNAVLTALSDKQFRLNVDKCVIRSKEITFLGFRINDRGIHPNPDKIAPIKHAARPTTLKQVQSFLGAVNYLSEFIPHLAIKAEPLRSLTRKNQSFQWNSEHEQAFDDLKRSISEDFQLAIFDPNADTIVTVDASDVGLGAQLSQIQDGREVPVQFASHTLLSRERNYAINEREALSCLWAIEKWEKFLLGRPFTLRTDHSSLLSLLTHSSSTKKSAKFTRWSQRLSRFDFTVEHIRGVHNCMADALSRLPQPSDAEQAAIEDDEPVDLKATIASLSAGPISLTTLRQQSSEDAIIKEAISYVSTAWPPRKHISPPLLPFYNVRSSLTVDDGCLIRDESRIVVPSTMQKLILTTAHEGHPGIVRTKRQLRQSYWWPGMDSQTEAHVRYCRACQDSAKSHKTTPPPPTSVPVPAEPWHKLALDICGPFANAPRNKRFVCVAIDYATGFPEILLTDDITSRRLINWLKDLFARFGNPALIVSDNGRQFCSDDFEDFLSRRDILHWRTAVYNPQQNGKVEAFNRYLKHGVQTFAASNTDFVSGIQQLLFNFRATSPTPDGKCPAELMFGRKPRTNFEPAHRDVESREPVLPTSKPVTSNPDAETSPQQPSRPRGPYRLNDLVRVRLPHVPKGHTPFSDPRRVTEVLGDYTYRLSDGQVWNARKLVRFRERPFGIEVESRPQSWREKNERRRQSTRKTRGVPPIRYPHSVVPFSRGDNGV